MKKVTIIISEISSKTYECLSVHQDSGGIHIVGEEEGSGFLVTIAYYRKEKIIGYEVEEINENKN